ncbi:lipoate--protein ligase family protein [Halorubrum sp. DTA46]|uniref:lipoate--protein ligase family protein n=1 Tax=Halorubrum sp. DTA46 TaxID=3402162 RepID=UPI003AACB318
MRVLRDVAQDSTNDPAADRDRTASLLAAAADGTPGLRVWTPPKQFAFGPRDARVDGYDRATRLAADKGFQPVERDVGGRAVAYTGSTLAFAHAIPLGRGSTRGATTDEESIADQKPTARWASIDERYDCAMRTVVDAVRALGATVTAGEPDASFCPGDHSVRVADGGKLSGIAQRVRADAALVAGCLIVQREDAAAIAAVTDPVYDALGVPFDAGTVGSVEAAGGPSDVERVARALEDAFVESWGDGARRIRRTESDG